MINSGFQNKLVHFKFTQWDMMTADRNDEMITARLSTPNCELTRLEKYARH